MAVDGKIAKRAKGIIPVTWFALLDSPYYGEEYIKSVIDLSKEIVFGSVVSDVAVETQPLRVVDYLAKLTVIELIPTAIDYWMVEPIQKAVTGSDENATYTDRAVRLQELRKNLIDETRKLAPQIEQIVGNRQVKSSRPLLNTLDDEFLTPSPQEFPRPFQSTGRS